MEQGSDVKMLVLMTEKTGNVVDTCKNLVFTQFVNSENNCLESHEVKKQPQLHQVKLLLKLKFQD